MKGLVVFFAAVCIWLYSMPAMGSHAMGGEISFWPISPTEYYVTVKFYRECGGGAIPAPAVIGLFAECNGQHLTSTQLPQLSSQDITPICNGTVSNYCNGGNAPGFEEYIYADTVVVSTANCPNLLFYFSECCRNSAITSLSSSGSYMLYLFAETDASIVPSNTSPIFVGPPVFLVPVNTPVELNFNAVDLDGDSLSYRLAQPLDALNGPIPYSNGYSVSSPVISSTPIILDSTTGILTFTPSVPQVSVLTVEVSEYRLGQLISRIIRDVQINASGILPSNSLPELSGVDSTSSYQVYVCVGDTLDFNIYSFDLDSGQVLSIDGLVNNTGGPIATLGAGSHPTIHVNWVPGMQHVSAMPTYTYFLTVRDNACPINGVKHYAYDIFVTNCTSDVWPGDANADFVANNYDIINIGRAFNYTGPLRASASTNWTGQPAADWANHFNSGLNHKHADCNGDGTVDSFDLDVITLNYGQTHLKTNERSSVGLPLSVMLSADTFVAGTVVNLPVHLGSVSEPANDVYGLAFKVDYDERVFDASTFTINFDNNWLANNSNEAIVFYQHDELNGSVDVAISRNNQSDINGLGELCSISLTLKDSLTDSLVATDVVVLGAMLEDFNETSIAVNELDVTIIAKLPQDTTNLPIDTTHIGINETVAQLRLYPNPATNTLTIQTDVVLQAITLYTISGKMLGKYDANSMLTQVDVSALGSGAYIVIGETVDGKRFYARFVKTGVHQ